MPDDKITQETPVVEADTVETDKTDTVQATTVDVGRITLNEVLKDPEAQADFDRRVAKATKKAVERAMAEASMSEDERAEQLYAERLKELEEREALYERKEFLADVRVELRDLNLPSALADLIVRGSTRDEYAPILKSIKSTWDHQLSEAVKASARQPLPGAGATEPSESEGFDLASYAQQNRKVR